MKKFSENAILPVNAKAVPDNVKEVRKILFKAIVKSEEGQNSGSTLLKQKLVRIAGSHGTSNLKF